MSRPSSSCIFGSIGPVEVFERGSYIVGILLCFLKKVGHTLLSRIISRWCSSRELTGRSTDIHEQTMLKNVPLVPGLWRKFPLKIIKESAELKNLPSPL